MDEDFEKLSAESKAFILSLNLKNFEGRGNQLSFVTDRLLYLEGKRPLDPRIVNYSCYLVRYKTAIKLLTAVDKYFNSIKERS